MRRFAVILAVALLLRMAPAARAGEVCASGDRTHQMCDCPARIAGYAGSETDLVTHAAMDGCAVGYVGCQSFAGPALISAPLSGGSVCIDARACYRGTSLRRAVPPGSLAGGIKATGLELLPTDPDCAFSWDATPEEVAAAIHGAQIDAPSEWTDALTAVVHAERAVLGCDAHWTYTFGDAGLEAAVAFVQADDYPACYDELYSALSELFPAEEEGDPGRVVRYLNGVDEGISMDADLVARYAQWPAEGGGMTALLYYADESDSVGTALLLVAMPDGAN